MRLAAPKDRKTAQSRINWIVRQLVKADSENIFVNAIWPGRAQDTQASLAELRENPQLLRVDNIALVPQYFDAVMVRDLAGKFAGPRTFIEHLEEIVPNFYEQVGQHLRTWVAPPPKLVERGETSAEEEETERKRPEPSMEKASEPSPATWNPCTERPSTNPQPQEVPKSPSENQPGATSEHQPEVTRESDPSADTAEQNEPQE